MEQAIASQSPTEILTLIVTDPDGTECILRPRPKLAYGKNLYGFLRSDDRDIRSAVERVSPCLQWRTRLPNSMRSQVLKVC